MDELKELYEALERLQSLVFAQCRLSREQSLVLTKLDEAGCG